MLFGLKNAGATYQRAMQNIFADMIHEDLEDYVDDIIVKSKGRKIMSRHYNEIYAVVGSTI